MNRSRSIIVIVIFAILIWNIFAPPQKITRFRVSVTNILGFPIKIAGSSFRYLRTMSHLLYEDPEKRELKRRISELETKLLKAEEVRAENKRLRALLDFKRRTRRRSFPALIVGRDPNHWSSILFIDKGSNDGIAKDTVVLSGRGLVGRVQEAGNSMSKVILINDVDSKVGALLQKNRIQGLLIGTAEGRCKLIYLPLEADIEQGDVVVTSGMGGIYPKGLVIGKVAKVGKEAGRLYQYAFVEPSTNLSRLEEVLCIQ